MSDHPAEIAERAAAYALGTLTGPELDEFEEHLNEGCIPCAREVDAFRAVGAHIGNSVVPVRPDPSVRARVLARIAPDSPSFIHKTGLLFARGNAVGWSPTSFDRVEVKLLFEDSARAVATRLVRMGPGASYPNHKHVGIEELYVLEGDLGVSGFVMHAGDYCRAEPGSIHSDIATQSGCLFISTSSTLDELLV